MLNYTERETRQNFFQASISILFLTFLLLLVYYFKGEPKNQDSFFHLANIKSISETGVFRNPTEPLSYIAFFILKKISFSTINFAFLLFSAFSLSIFFHLALYLFKREIWDLNHYLSVYLLAFIPMNFNLPFLLHQELVCANLILLLLVFTRMDTIQNLLLVILLSILAFLTNLKMFLFLYTIYVILSSYIFMGKQKSRTTVFYKRTNIAGRLLSIYLLLFFVGLIYIYFTQFFGENSLQFLFLKFFQYSYRILPAFICSFLLYYLLENEKELHNRITSIFAVILIFILAYLSYINKSDLPESMEKEVRSIEQTYNSGKLLKGQIIHTSPLIADYMYLTSNQKVYPLEYTKIKKDDYYLVNFDFAIDKIQVDKNYKPKYTPFLKLTEKSLLLNKEYSDKIISEKNELNASILNSINSTQKIFTKYTKWNAGLCKVFGY
jgi:hypothetical protein